MFGAFVFRPADEHVTATGGHESSRYYAKRVRYVVVKMNKSADWRHLTTIETLQIVIISDVVDERCFGLSETCAPVSFAHDKTVGDPDKECTPYATVSLRPAKRAQSVRLRVASNSTGYDETARTLVRINQARHIRLIGNRVCKCFRTIRPSFFFCYSFQGLWHSLVRYYHTTTRPIRAPRPV